jgi:peptidoglycan hydrolase CwlO-like protein
MNCLTKNSKQSKRKKCSVAGQGTRYPLAWLSWQLSFCYAVPGGYHPLTTPTMHTNNSEADEVTQLKRMIIRMINEIKEDINKCLNEFQQNTNQLNKLRKIMQDMKEEFNNDIEILKTKIKLKFWT